MLDLSRLAPGPNASRLLADMGMDVIKVEESAARGGFHRDTLTPISASDKEQTRWAAYNVLGRNKRSIALNLKDERGREVFYRLARTADVVLEGYRPGVVYRIGVDYETLREINPAIVYCSISGMGQDGPYRDRAGHDANYQALAGLMALGSDGDGTPTYPGYSVADHGAALHAVIGILAALLGRAESGRGQYIDIAMTDVLNTFIPTQSGNYFRDQAEVQRGAHWLHQLTVLRCQDGKYLCTQNAETYFWERFCSAIAREDLAALPRAADDPGFPKLVEEVRRTMLTKTRDEWLDILVPADTCVSPVNELSEAFDDPHMVHRQTVWELEHPVVGQVKQIGFPIKFSETPGAFRSFAPSLGEHTVELLRLAAYTEAEIETLLADGVAKAATAGRGGIEG
jgi:crotonobetainyl-CoA:carnitine CoA-transferase CaiB-like acyl-CoA transferase